MYLLDGRSWSDDSGSGSSVFEYVMSPLKQAFERLLPFLLVPTEESLSDWQSARGPVRPTFMNLVVVVTPNTCSAGP